MASQPAVEPSSLTPRLAAQRAREVAASHRALPDSTCTIDSAWSHAHGISTGAVAVLRAYLNRIRTRHA
jgi:hypothetical protein